MAVRHFALFVRCSTFRMYIESLSLWMNQIVETFNITPIIIIILSSSLYNDSIHPFPKFDSFLTFLYPNSTSPFVFQTAILSSINICSVPSFTHIVGFIKVLLGNISFYSPLILCSIEKRPGTFRNVVGFDILLIRYSNCELQVSRIRCKFLPCAHRLGY